MPTPFPNQPPPYADRDLLTDDAALREALEREGGGASRDEVGSWGRRLGRAETLALADAANRNPPQLRTHDARGERVDAVDFHPAWHELMRLAGAEGEHCAPWSNPVPGAQVARAAKYHLHAQVENGTQCPLTMTFASFPVLARAASTLPSVARDWIPRLLTRDYDPRTLPVAQKRSLLIGMGMTERQGGSDVRSNTTRAESDPASGEGTVRLTGHKWFFSAPQCDGHLVLAREGAGISCFLLPRFLPDGARNAVRINRLKDKLGNRSNASSEVEFDRALAWPVGEPGRGVTTILEMVQHTRLDCVLGTAGMMRAALARAIHYARHRVAFGRLLVQKPLMRNVLADLALEVEAATALALRLARAFEADAPEAERALARIVTPAAKYWLCKRGPALAAEAMEVNGGSGYVEESALPRIYREMPVNSIWEGSGNVICLDVVRAMKREPAARDALLAEIAAARGVHAAFDAFTGTLARDIEAPSDDEWHARSLAQRVAVSLQASLLLRHAPASVSDAFCATRLDSASFAGAAFGALPSGIAASEIIDRALAG